MFDYQGLLVDKSFEGLPIRLISEITTRAGLPNTGESDIRESRAE